MMLFKKSLRESALLEEKKPEDFFALEIILLVKAVGGPQILPSIKQSVGIKLVIDRYTICKNAVNIHEITSPVANPVSPLLTRERSIFFLAAAGVVL